MNEYDICRDIVNLNDNIYGAGIIDNQQLVARFVRKGKEEHLIDEERFKLMIARPEIIMSMIRTNEEFFGSLHYVILCFENSDFFFFSDPEGSKSRIFYVRMKRTFRGEEVLQNVHDYLGSRARSQVSKA
jgi:hypothetical protein